MRGWLLLYFATIVTAYDICVIGATSGLGKELVYQATTQHRMKVLALTSKSETELRYPCRENSFRAMHDRDVFRHPNLTVGCYHVYEEHAYEEAKHLVFCTRAPPFVYDYTADLMRVPLPSSTQSATWIAPHKGWYIHPSIKEQNKAFRALLVKKRFIFRPKGLTNEPMRNKAITRQKLARRILINIKNPHHW